MDMLMGSLVRPSKIKPCKAVQLTPEFLRENLHLRQRTFLSGLPAETQLLTLACGRGAEMLKSRPS